MQRQKTSTWALVSIRELINRNIWRYTAYVPLCIFSSVQDIYNKFMGSNSNISSSGDIYLNWKYSNETIKQAHDDWKHYKYIFTNNDCFFIWIRVIC